DGASYLETLSETAFHRYAMSGQAVGKASVRIDRLGRAWVAYETGKGVRIARFTGHSFTSVSIGVTLDDSTFTPNILIDAANRPYVTWIREPDQGGCVTREVEPADGIYYATNASGAWKIHRITHRLGEFSIVLDTKSRLRLVVNSGDGILRYIAQTASGTFRTTILSSRPVMSAQIHIDPLSGAAVVTYLRDVNGSTRSVSITTHA